MITTYSAISRLDMYLTHLGIPIIGVSQTGSTFTVQYAANATPGQITQGNQIASTWPTTAYRSRLLWDIWQQLNALTTKQQNSITADLQTGSPPKQFVMEQSNTSSAFSSWQVSSGASMTSAAFYIQDNPLAYVNPPIDPSINVPGWEPVP